MNYAQIKKLDIANGPGIRVSLFVSGCTHKCKGCFNEEYQSFDYGQVFTKNNLDEIKNELEKDYCSGLTLLGGEPLQNLELIEFVEEIKEYANSLKEKKDIWIYSGYVFEKIKENTKMKKLLELCDVLVDGPFVEELLDLNLKFRGSSNQRILDVKKSLEADKAIHYTI